MGSAGRVFFTVLDPRLRANILYDEVLDRSPTMEGECLNDFKCGAQDDECFSVKTGCQEGIQWGPLHQQRRRSVALQILKSSADNERGSCSPLIPTVFNTVTFSPQDHGFGQ